MQPQSFKPNPRYLWRLRLVVTIVALLILASGLLLAWLISLDPEARHSAGVVAIVWAGLDLLWYVPALFLTAPYYRSLRYEIQDDEVIVHVGIWTRSVKHVPYRTVTNLTAKRDVLDRWLGIGSLQIQTAGMSGKTGAEESLVGLPNVQEVYELVVAALRRFRGAMAPTAAEVQGEGAAAAGEALSAILSEVRAIRRALEERSGRP